MARLHRVSFGLATLVQYTGAITTKPHHGHVFKIRHHHDNISHHHVEQPPSNTTLFLGNSKAHHRHVLKSSRWHNTNSYQHVEQPDLNTTLVEGRSQNKELEYSIHFQEPADGPVMDKVVITIIEIVVMGLGFCGVDRCYMGQPLLGLLKAFSCGGCCFWFLLDLIVISSNVLSKAPYIDSVGYVATWDPSSISTAFTLAAVFLPVYACCCCCGCLGSGTANARTTIPQRMDQSNSQEDQSNSQEAPQEGY